MMDRYDGPYRFDTSILRARAHTGPTTRAASLLLFSRVPCHEDTF